MAEVLTQSEIDALLAAVSTGNVPTDESNRGAGDWIAYDLTSQEKFVRGRFTGLEGIHERFARRFRMTLSSALKKNATITPVGMDFQRFGEYLGSVLLPTSLNIIRFTNLRGHLVFAVSSKLAYALIDAYYGGSERPFAQTGRDAFTTIEKNMIRKISGLMIRDLEEAWKPNFPVTLEQVGEESNPSFVGSIHATELVAVANFEVQFENLSGSFSLLMQVSALDPIQEKLRANVTSEFPDDWPAWREHWQRELPGLELAVRAELGSVEYPLRKIQDLKIGDMLVLGQDAAGPVTVLIEETPKIRGLMGVRHGNAAVCITDDLEHTEGENGER